MHELARFSRNGIRNTRKSTIETHVGIRFNWLGQEEEKKETEGGSVHDGGYILARLNVCKSHVVSPNQQRKYTRPNRI